MVVLFLYFFFQAEDGIRDADVTGVQTCALPICSRVDTGRMRSEVESYQFASLTLVGIEFGWAEGNPHYAPYQEFGVPSHNIKPMRAVQQTYHEVWGRTRTEVAR